ncbi:DUF1861 family protein [Alkalibacterium putridalgicola]|uniref:DUF1861 family protein n=1 Tax=Alkalibacterium putridalgicola TaxID=426703 RepID=UPI0034CF1E97
MNTVDKLLGTYRETLKEQTKNPEHIIFEGVKGFDVYNVTAPFIINNTKYIAGRVEKRDSEHSKVYFFKNNMNVWTVDDEAPVFELQDPFVTFVEDELVFGGVEIFESKEEPGIFKWRTVFYKGETLQSLERIFEGPMGMKDLRLKELHDGRILVMTRPQGNPGGRGTIGAVVVASLNDLSVEVINSASLFDDMYPEDEWGGANEVHLLDNKTVGVLGHIAKFDKSGDRHYYSMAFTLDIETMTPSELKIIAERNDFLEGPTKRLDLQDVIFSGGLVRSGNEATLYSGISDARAQKVTILDPFR